MKDSISEAMEDARNCVNDEGVFSTDQVNSLADMLAQLETAIRASLNPESDRLRRAVNKVLNNPNSSKSAHLKAGRALGQRIKR